MTDTEFTEQVKLNARDPHPEPPAALVEIEHEITSEYDITDDEITTMKQATKTITESLFTDMFNGKENCLTEDAILLIQRQLLGDVLFTMNTKNWPVKCEELTFSDVFDAFSAATPEEYFNKLTSRLTTDEEDARGFINSRISRMYRYRNEGDPIHQYVTARNKKQRNETQ